MDFAKTLGGDGYLILDDVVIEKAYAKKLPWAVETVFRDSKQYGGLEACQCWVDQAWVRYVGLVLLTFVVLQPCERESYGPLGSVDEAPPGRASFGQC